jgi:hypothetical protein
MYRPWWAVLAGRGERFHTQLLRSLKIEKVATRAPWLIIQHVERSWETNALKLGITKAELVAETR